MDNRRERAIEALRGIKASKVNNQRIVDALMSDELKDSFNKRVWRPDEWNLAVVEDIASLLESDTLDGYMKLPRDANGEYIHLYDRMHNTTTGEDFTAIAIGVTNCNPCIGHDAVYYQWGDSVVSGNCHHCEHRKKTTVEDLLAELVADVRNIPPLCADYWREVDRAVAKYADQLTVKEEE